MKRELAHIEKNSFNDEDLYKLRHSMAHLLAEAMLALMPEAKLAIGPPVEHGFYYDFELPRALTKDDFPTLEQKMQEIISGNYPFVAAEVTREEARRHFANQPYKLEIINRIDRTEPLTTFTQHTFTDLCKGPHVAHTGDLNRHGFKLLSVAGAYWRGNEENTMLQRVYGTAWKSREELNNYLLLLEEIEKRDHRKLGTSLNLFSTHQKAGAGLIYWHPRGARIRLVIEDYWRALHLAHGYELLYTPHIGKSWLWEQSGHLDFYQQNMFAPIQIENTDYYTKPMNCPFHIMIYQSGTRSYRDLPLRWAELGTVYRYERSGVLHGLLRVRGFTQDDAHIFCTPEQVLDEIGAVLDFSLKVWKDFGFSNLQAFLATQPAKSVGDAEEWRTAEESLKTALIQKGLDYTLEEGEGAFYGPKIDIKVKDALGRLWQMSTIQFDFNLPARFNMEYVDNHGVSRRPFMIHRALLGSLERFFGMLIEHYGGAFPLWLAPEQLRIIPVAQPFVEYATETCNWFCSHNLRAHVDTSNERLNAKIRLARVLKIPCVAVVGAKEVEREVVSLTRYGSSSSEVITRSDLLLQLNAEIAEKK